MHREFMAILARKYSLKNPNEPISEKENMGIINERLPSTYGEQKELFSDLPVEHSGQMSFEGNDQQPVKPVLQASITALSPNGQSDTRIIVEKICTPVKHSSCGGFEGKEYGSFKEICLPRCGAAIEHKENVGESTSLINQTFLKATTSNNDKF